MPPPLTRGILATALPVPHDSALVWWPALEDTAYGCRLFLDMLQWTKLTKSGRIGDLNTLGMVTFPPRAPSGLYTVTRGRDVCIGHGHRDMCMVTHSTQTGYREL